LRRGVHAAKNGGKVSVPAGIGSAVALSRMRRHPPDRNGAGALDDPGPSVMQRWLGADDMGRSNTQPNPASKLAAQYY
jgi:hypothetical protein